VTPREVLAAYEGRINQHDFDLLIDLIASDATFWFSDGSYHGHAEIRAAFDRTWKALANDTYWLEDVTWIAESDGTAACTYRFNWKTEIDGKPISGSGRGTTVLARLGDRWQIVHEHLSGNPS
jgi:ketosteroid isomerase-like protein